MKKKVILWSHQQAAGLLLNNLLRAFNDLAETNPEVIHAWLVGQRVSHTLAKNYYLKPTALCASRKLYVIGLLDVLNGAAARLLGVRKGHYIDAVYDEQTLKFKWFRISPLGLRKLGHKHVRNYTA